MSLEYKNKLYRFPDTYAQSTSDSAFWDEFSDFLRVLKPVDMGIGAPNFTSYEKLKEIIEEIANDKDYSIHQYAPIYGNMRLKKAIAQSVAKKYQIELNPITEILITVGGNGGLNYAALGFLNEGDEVILFEPFYLNYEYIFANSKAKVRYVPFKCKGSPGEDGCVTSDDWSWDDDELEAAFNPRTKLIVVNSPNNPIGKVLNERELRKIVDLCIKYNVICLADDVYENYIYTENKSHINIIQRFPEMRERTIVLISGGKMFGITGVKIGWIYGDPNLIKLCQVPHIKTMFTLPNLVQELVARCLEIENERLDAPECFFNRISKDLKPKRDRLVKILREAGFIPTIPDGGYFVLADFTKLTKNIQLEGAEDETVDVKFFKYLVKEKRVLSYPMSQFFSKSNVTGHKYLRFCFVKDDLVFDKVEQLLNGK